MIVYARQRATNLKAIDPELDLGGSLSVSNVDDQIEATQGSLDGYNTLLRRARGASRNSLSFDVQGGRKSRLKHPLR